MRKRILSILLCLVMVVGLFPTMAFAADGSGATTGSGTQRDPYCVSTYAEMKRLLQTPASYYIKVVGMDNDSKVGSVPVHRLIAGRDFKSTEPAIDIPYGAHHHLEIATKIWLVADPLDDEETNIFSRLIDVGSGSSLEITGTGSLRVEVNARTVKNAIIDNWGGELTIDGSVVLNGIQDFTTNVATRPIWIDSGVTNIKGGYIYGHNNMSVTNDEVTSTISFGRNFAKGTALNISGGTIKQVNNATNQRNENSCALYVDNDKAANAIHLTGGIFEGGMKMAMGKPLSGLLDAGYQFYDMGANTVFDGSVSKTQKKLIVTPTGVNPTVIDKVSLNIKSLNERKTLSDLACSYSPNNKMVLDNFVVFKGLKNERDKIEDQNTPYNANQEYTVMYVFYSNDDFSFSNNIEDNVTVTGGDFWKADSFGGLTNTLRVFVNFPASAIDKVSLTIKPEDERKTISDLACSYSPESGMTLKNFSVYKGLNSTSDKITDKTTPYDPNQSYTATYVFNANVDFYFSSNLKDNLKDNVTVTGGDFWMADDFGGLPNIIRVFVTFPGATPIDSVTLNVPELKVGDTSGDFTLSGTNTGVSTVTTEWKDIPPTGAVESTFYSARITLTAEDGYVFDANTNVTLIGDNWGSATGISSDGKTMTVLVSVRILHKHTFGTWQDLGNSEYHFRSCSCLAQEKEPHTWKYDDSLDKYQCTVCGHEIDGEKERITYVAAYPRSPIAGESPSSHTPEEWVDNGGVNYTVESIVWKNMDDTNVTTFEAGKIYKGTVTFKADEGFVFAETINGDHIFNSSTVKIVGNYTLGDGAKTLTATFELENTNVVKPGLDVKVKLPTLNDKIGRSLPAVELVDTTLPENVTLTYNVYENNLSTEVTDPDYKVKPNQKYYYSVWLKHGDSTDITEITKTYNVSYEVTDGGDAETYFDVGNGVLAMYQTPDTSKINSVALTVTAPKYGEAPATTATGANDTLYTVGTPTWSPAVADGKFGADTYTVSIPVTAKSGYSFDENGIYTINGYVATYAGGKVSYEFPALTAPHEHNFGTWTKWTDSHHSRSCTICGDVQFEAHDFSAWTKVDKTNHSRTCSKCTKPGETANYTETANHNWEYDETNSTPAIVDAAGKNAYKCADCKATKTENIPALTAISAVNVTVTAPVKGATPGTATTADTTYSVAYTDWEPIVSSTFAGGTKYTVKVSLDANGNNRFTNATTFQINGQTATVVGTQPTAAGADSTKITLEFPATSSGSTGGGGGTGVTTYAITVKSAKNGDVTASHKSASKGTTVTLTVDPDKGYVLDTLTVLDGKDKEIKLTEKNGKYTFTMPDSKVTVEATFKASAPTGKNPFIDVPAGSYYEDAVIWAVGKGITTGTSATTFNPNGICTRAQAVTFLWRAAGSPAAKSAVMPFTDVKAGSYYYDAVLWAVEQGITKGTSDTMFSPDATCTRAQIVTFLWRANGSPAVSGNSAFTDVAADAYYAAAVTWAEKNDVTGGIGGGLFGSNNNCTRAQIVTFIYRSVK